METKDYKLFGNTTMSDLMEDIYKNSVEKSKRLESIIHDYNKLIKTTDEAYNLGPIIADFMDISVKNDDQLVRLATVVQRIVAAEHKFTEEGEILSEDEKKQLMEAARESLEEISKRIDTEGIPPLPDAAK